MHRNRLAFLMLAGLVAAPLGARAEDAISAPAQKMIGKPSQAKPEMVPALIVMNADGASLDGSKLTLTGVAPNAIMFADRPVRAAGHALTIHLIEEWAPGKGTFDKDPPNATVSVLAGDGGKVADAVVVLKQPALSGDKLTFNVEVLEGSLAGADGPASLFIDNASWNPGYYAEGGTNVGSRAAWYQTHSAYTPNAAWYTGMNDDDGGGRR